ncbi:hypothetical protein BB561_005314 [Smittium simulii]|uniref:Uncharacterized protein n=1 Tax=Smittium simulii TaxID=133385 RepID=A0A2T9YAZ7_9FUNG|nr:hypothetical protein BB561_005314 [Smittium simulii]
MLSTIARAFTPQNKKSKNNAKKKNPLIDFSTQKRSDKAKMRAPLNNDPVILLSSMDIPLNNKSQKEKMAWANSNILNNSKQDKSFSKSYHDIKKSIPTSIEYSHNPFFTLSRKIDKRFTIFKNSILHKKSRSTSSYSHLPRKQTLAFPNESESLYYSCISIPKSYSSSISSLVNIELPKPNQQSLPNVSKLRRRYHIKSLPHKKRSIKPLAQKINFSPSSSLPDIKISSSLFPSSVEGAADIDLPFELSTKNLQALVHSTPHVFESKYSNILHYIQIQQHYVITSISQTISDYFINFEKLETQFIKSNIQLSKLTYENQRDIQICLNGIFLDLDAANELVFALTKFHFDKFNSHSQHLNPYLTDLFSKPLHIKNFNSLFTNVTAPLVLNKDSFINLSDTQININQTIPFPELTSQANHNILPGFYDSNKEFLLPNIKANSHSLESSSSSIMKHPSQNNTIAPFNNHLKQKSRSSLKLINDYYIDNLVLADHYKPAKKTLNPNTDFSDDIHSTNTINKADKNKNSNLANGEYKVFNDTDDDDAPLVKIKNNIKSSKRNTICSSDNLIQRYMKETPIQDIIQSMSLFNDDIALSLLYTYPQIKKLNPDNNIDFNIKQKLSLNNLLPNKNQTSTLTQFDKPKIRSDNNHLPLLENSIPYSKYHHHHVFDIFPNLEDSKSHDLHFCNSKSNSEDLFKFSKSLGYDLNPTQTAFESKNAKSFQPSKNFSSHTQKELNNKISYNSEIINNFPQTSYCKNYPDQHLTLKTCHSTNCKNFHGKKLIDEIPIRNGLYHQNSNMELNGRTFPKLCNKKKSLNHLNFLSHVYQKKKMRPNGNKLFENTDNESKLVYL